MDLPALTLSVLVKMINRSNSSGDGFYTAHHRPSIGLTPVQPDSDYNRAHTPDAGGVLKPTDEGCRAVVVGAVSELVSLCEQFSRFVAVFVISLPVLWQFM